MDRASHDGTLRLGEGSWRGDVLMFEQVQARTIARSVELDADNGVKGALDCYEQGSGSSQWRRAALGQPPTRRACPKHDSPLLRERYMLKHSMLAPGPEGGPVRSSAGGICVRALNK